MVTCCRFPRVAQQSRQDCCHGDLATVCLDRWFAPRRGPGADPDVCNSQGQVCCLGPPSCFVSACDWERSANKPTGSVRAPNQPGESARGLLADGDISVGHVLRSLKRTARAARSQWPSARVLHAEERRREVAALGQPARQLPRASASTVACAPASLGRDRRRSRASAGASSSQRSWRGKRRRAMPRGPSM